MNGTIPEALRAFFREHPRLAIAFSGGADSAYLLYAALECGCDAMAYCVRSPFQPAFELEDARKLAARLGARLRVIDLDPLADEKVRVNPTIRCYYCKRAVLTAVWDAARADGRDVLIDGTNASDDAGDRPGIKALNELGVLSPLRDCGVMKAMVRQYSKAAGLFTWDKPAYACLATRVPAGTALTPELLARVEGAEAALRALGFSDFRCRVYFGAARLQLPAAQFADAARRRSDIRAALRPYFDVILLDTEDRG